MLADPARCQVVLVTLPETTPVNEAIETADALEERVGVQLGPVVVNAVDEGDDLPADAGTATARRCGPPPSSATPRRDLHAARSVRGSPSALDLAQLRLPLVARPVARRRRHRASWPTSLGKQAMSEPRRARPRDGRGAGVLRIRRGRQDHRRRRARAAGGA